MEPDLKYFTLGVLVVLIPSFYFQINLTADGPCHLYNAGLLNQYRDNLNQNFLQRWYEPNFLLFPNWFTHVLLGFLLKIFEPIWAEKIFQIGYVLLFAFFGYRLCKLIRPGNYSLAILLLPLVYHFHFYKGFYNYSYSIVFAMTFMIYWLKNRNDLTIKRLITAAILLLLIYFSHLMGVVLVIVFAICIFVTDLYKEISSDRKRALWLFLAQSSKYLLAFIPVIVLILGYNFSRKSEIGFEYKPSSLQLFYDLFKGWIFNCFSAKESGWSVIFAIQIITLSIGLPILLKRKTKSPYLFAFAFLSFIILTLYFISPNRFTGGERIVERFYYVFFLSLVWLINCFPVGKIVYHIVSVFVIIILLGFTTARWNVFQKTNETVSEFMKFDKYFDSWSTALVLNHSKKGIDLEYDGCGNISDNTLFIHCFQYLGVNKPVVFFDNYEGQSGLFPFKWKVETDPYTHLAAGNGIEGEPTGVDIEKYELKTKQYVDIVLTYGFERYSNDSMSSITKNVLKRNYLCVDSALGILKIYKRK